MNLGFWICLDDSVLCLKFCMYIYSSCAPIFFPQNICIVISLFFFLFLPFFFLNSFILFFYLFIFSLCFFLLFFVAVGLPVYLNIKVEGL